MSKTKLNTVSPDELFDRYGADTVHTYILSMAPPDRDVIYSERNVVGINRFLKRLWDTVVGALPVLEGRRGAAVPPALRQKTHQVIRTVTEAFESDFHFNVAIARIMELVNAVRDVLGKDAPSPPSPPRGQGNSEGRGGSTPNGHNPHPNPLPERERGQDPGAAGTGLAALREALESTVQLLAPFAPHVAEELWSRLGRAPSVFRHPWPVYDEAAARAEEVEIVIQVNGKVRARMTVERDLDAAALSQRALGHPRLEPFLAGHTVRDVIVVPNRLVNLVVR